MPFISNPSFKKYASSSNETKLSESEKQNEMTFECDQCGLCCRNLQNSPIYDTLNRCDGVCKYFNELTNLCSIYHERPVICNVLKAYDMYFKDKFTYEEYIQLNRQACNALKKKGC